MPLKLYNTFTRKLETFKPLKDKRVGLYTCGPTVYQYAHIGNLRTYIFEDILERTLKWNGYKVKRVMNITDVGHLTSDADTGEDKIEKGAKAERKTPAQIAAFYTRAFLADIKKLNIKKPPIVAPATKYIKEQQALVKELRRKGYAYETPTAVYFNVAKFKKYGQLSGQSLAQKITAARREVVEDKRKKNPADFVLWFKLIGKYKNHVQHWPSPWGEGFPGWHIECSAISRKLLGQPFDIHTGGVDHIGTHHENEIAQSQAAYGKLLAKYWLHGEFLRVIQQTAAQAMNFRAANNTHQCPRCQQWTVVPTEKDYIEVPVENGTDLHVICKNCGKQFFGGIRLAKMAKSERNFLTLYDLEEKGYSPLAYRYLVLGTHYRQKLNFSWEALKAAEAGLKNIYSSIADYAARRQRGKIVKIQLFGKAKKYYDAFSSAMNSDLNTPKALAILHLVINTKDIGLAEKMFLITNFDEILGLNIGKRPLSVPTPINIRRLAAQREQFRRNKQFVQADRLREEIKRLGYVVEDTPSGPAVRPR